MLDPRSSCARSLRSALFVLSLFGTVVSEATAEPTPAEIESAKAAFFRALDLELANDWEGALAELSAVAKVKTTPQVMFHIGLCQENLGRLLLARESFAKSLAQAESEAAAEVLENAPKRILALDERIPTLQIEVPKRNDDLQVWVNGTEIAPSEFGKATPREPGRVRIEKRIGSTRTTVRELELSEGTRHVERIDAPPPKPAGPLLPIAGSPLAPTDSAAIESKIPAIIVGSVGVASAIASATCLGVSFAIQSDVESRCTNPEAGTGCDPSDEDLSGDGERLRSAGIALAAISGASLVTGVVLWFALDENDAPAVPSSAARPRVGIDVSARFMGVRGDF